MQGRDGNKAQSNAPYGHASSIASNDGTLNAIVSKSIRSLDVPVSNAIAHEDEMLSWLHYPVEDPLDRGYCSDMFGELPTSGAQVLRHSFNQAGFRPQNAPSSSSTSIFSGMLSSHPNPGVSAMDARTALSASPRDAAESCGSGLAEANCRVAGADAVVALGVYRAADFTTSHLGMEVFNKMDSEGEVLSKLGSMGQPVTCNSASANTMFNMQSERSQSLSQGSSQQQASFVGDVHTSYPKLKPLDFVNSHIPPVLTEKQTASNFSIFTRPVEELKANLHMVGGSSSPANMERLKQHMGMVQESMNAHTLQTAYMGAGHERYLLPPAPLPLPQPAFYSTSVGLEKVAGVHPSRSPPSLPPPISDIDAREGTNLTRDTISNSRMSIMSSEKGLGMQDQTTSPSRYSASSTERSGKVTDQSAKEKKAGVGEASNYQSEDASEMENVKRACSNSKRMRTAEMHNQSERKRRVKINDKLKILQELIPNGNKPDKASLLDAVIEYVKMLQSQLQMMSMRTGAGIPSWMIPNVNMPHLQMSALPQMKLGADMGMGVGVGMGTRMGMGMMDSNAAAIRGGCALMPITMYPGQPPTGLSSHSSTLQPADQMHAHGIVNAHNFYVAAPSHVQHLPMNLNMGQSIPMYNPYIAQPQLQVPPCPQPQQQQLQVQMQQPHPPPGNNGKKPVH